MPDLRLKVIPGASQTRVVGWLGDSLKVAVSAPPESGKANAAVLELLAQALNIPPKSLQLISGQTQPRKLVRITGLTDSELQQKLRDTPK